MASRCCASSAAGRRRATGWASSRPAGQHAGIGAGWRRGEEGYSLRGAPARFGDGGWRRGGLREGFFRRFSQAGPRVWLGTTKRAPFRGRRGGGGGGFPGGGGGKGERGRGGGGRGGGGGC
eukprot:SAG31_NODE_1920_length_6919_cov_7.423754_1_plen_121_part_00